MNEKENGGKAGDIEVIEPEIETLPEAGGLVKQSAQGIEDQLFLADNIQKLIDAQNKIRNAILKLAQPGDWVLFKSDKDDIGKAEIGFAGAMRIGSTVGISFLNWEAKKEIGRDDLGEWYRWEYECDAVFRNRTIRVFGRAGSRDKFFGKAHGEFKPLHEVDEGNIKQAARRSAIKEGIKCHLGLHHMDPEYIKKNGITLVSAGGYSFKGKETKADELESVTVAIADVVVGKKTDKWTRYIVKDVEGVSYNTFSETIAKQAKALKESKTQATISYKQTQYGNEIVGIVNSNEVAEAEK